METYLKTLEGQLRQTPQDPIWHGEGDVWNHTRLVVQALQELPEYREAEENTQKLLYLAAVFHDIGKISATRLEDGRWVAPGHGRVGAQMTRRMLWQEHGLCGSREGQQLREGICALVRYHSLPVHAIEEPEGKLRLLRFAANGSLVPLIMVKNLCTLAKADILGRICPDQQELLEKVALCQELAQEAGCYEGPYPFPTAHTRYSCLSGREIPMDYPLYDDTWGPVILMCGLPGTGKDTWIRENCLRLPMISLDGIRKELGISPKGNQTQVVEEARERARELLRRRECFVWNATNLSPMIRQKQLGLFASYGASVRIVYLETAWEEELRRNKNRGDVVPEPVVERMLETLSPPEMAEAVQVDWLLV